LEIIYLEIENEDVDMRLLVIPEFKEQVKGWGDLMGSYKLFADKLKEGCPNLRGGREDTEAIEGLFREILSTGFLGSGIGNDVEVKVRY
jgi:hypothetical protein